MKRMQRNRHAAYVWCSHRRTDHFCIGVGAWEAEPSLPEKHFDSTRKNCSSNMTKLACYQRTETSLPQIVDNRVSYKIALLDSPHPIISKKRISGT